MRTGITGGAGGEGGLLPRRGGVRAGRKVAHRPRGASLPLRMAAPASSDRERLRGRGRGAQELHRSLDWRGITRGAIPALAGRRDGGEVVGTHKAPGAWPQPGGTGNWPAPIGEIKSNGRKDRGRSGNASTTPQLLLPPGAGSIGTHPAATATRARSRMATFMVACSRGGRREPHAGGVGKGRAAPPRPRGNVNWHWRVLVVPGRRGAGRVGAAGASFRA